MTFLSVLLLVATVLLPRTCQATVSSPASLYESLASAIDSADTNFVLYLNMGHFRSKLVSGGNLFWNISDNTTATVRASYSSGGLQDGASLSFSKPVVVWYGGLSQIFLNSIKYNSLGDAQALDAAFVNPINADPQATINLQRSLRFARQARQLFLGSPFGLVSKIEVCNATFTICNVTTGASSLVSEVRLLQMDLKKHGFFAKLKTGATVNFTDPQALPGKVNTLTLGSGSSVNFDDVDYFLSGQIIGHLEQLNLTVSSGTLNGGAASLQLANSQVKFASLSFSRSPGSAAVDARDGSIDGSFDTGTRLSLGRNLANDDMYVSLGASSSVKLRGMALTLDDQAGSTIDIGGGSMISLHLSDSHIPLGSSGYVGLTSGDFDANVGGHWGPTGSSVDGVVSQLDGTIASGKILPNAQSILMLASGSISASNLAIHTAQTPALVGSLQTFAVQMADKSVVALPNGMTMSASRGSLTMDTNNPFQWTNRAFPNGGASVSLSLRDFIDRADPSFKFSNGTLAFNSVFSANGDVHLSSLSETNGTMSFRTAMSANPIVAAIVLHDGVIDSVGNTVTGHAKIGGTLQPNISYNFVTPYQHGTVHDDGSHHDSETLFSMTFNLGFSQPANFPDTDITFGKDGAHTSFAVTFPVSVVVPEGGGEHKDDQHPEKGTKGGDEDWQHGQEIWTDPFETCRAHLYLLPSDKIGGSYSMSAQLNASVNGKSMTVSVGHLTTDRAIGWHKDGCNLNVIGIVAGAIGGLVVSGPVGMGLGAVAGGVVGGHFEDDLQTRIGTMLAAKIQGFGTTWSIDT